MKPRTRRWISDDHQVGRVNNSVDCLTIILDKSFKDAVYELTGQDISRTRSNTSYVKKNTAPVRQSEKPQEKNV